MHHTQPMCCIVLIYIRDNRVTIYSQISLFIIFGELFSSKSTIPTPGQLQEHFLLSSCTQFGTHSPRDRHQASTKNIVTLAIIDSDIKPYNSLVWQINLRLAINFTLLLCHLVWSCDCTIMQNAVITSMTWCIYTERERSQMMNAIQNSRSVGIYMTAHENGCWRKRATRKKPNNIHYEDLEKWLGKSFMLIFVQTSQGNFLVLKQKVSLASVNKTECKFTMKVMWSDVSGCLHSLHKYTLQTTTLGTLKNWTAHLCTTHAACTYIHTHTHHPWWILKCPGRHSPVAQ